MPVKGNPRTFNRVIKDFDLFGHSVQLNFNKNGRLHKTFIGGFISIIFLIVAFFVLLNNLG
jgi:hypothetical protein